MKKNAIQKNKLLFRHLGKKKKKDMQNNAEYIIPFLCVFSLSIVITKKTQNGKHYPNF